MLKKTVYWLVYEKYIVPEDLNWSNKFYIIEHTHSSVDSITDEIIADIKASCPASYAIVTDLSNDLDLRILNRKFISNNIVQISESYDVKKTTDQLAWILSNFGMNRMPEKSRVFFISDTHFGHAAICRYCNRPWNSGKDEHGELIVTQADVDRMDAEIIKRWNSIVGKNDIVWHLGDFAMGANQTERIPLLASKLNGRINLVLGNHDKRPIKFYYEAGFNRIYDKPVVLDSFCILSHTPMEFVKAPWFSIYGHVHDCETYKTWSKDSCCVCVERHNYAPVSWEEIKKRYDELNSQQ